MQLNYTITQEHYEDVIAFQLKLQRSKRRSLIQYIVTNAIFIILAVYFLVTHPESSVWSRLGVMGMAAAMLVLTTDRRSCSPGKVRRTYKRYVRLKLIQDGFIGPHTLLVDKNSVTQKFGDQSNTIEIKRCAWVNGENRISMILGGGVIFEIIPNEVLDQNGNRERLSALIAGHDADGTASDKLKQFLYPWRGIKIYYFLFMRGPYYGKKSCSLGCSRMLRDRQKSDHPCHAVYIDCGSLCDCRSE